MLLAMPVQLAATVSDPADDPAGLLIRLAAAADVSDYLERIAQFPDSEQKRALTRQFSNRFVRGDSMSESGDQFVDAVLDSFRMYWNQVLWLRHPSAVAEARLAESLSDSLNMESPLDLPVALARVNEQLERKGFHALLSPPAPLADLLIWKKENREDWSVALVDQDRQVEVVFVDDVITAGWLDYASLGLTAVSGWTDGHALYSPLWAYDTASEAFRVSYLTHEAQHLSDLDQFPHISTENLEYRAKLSELAFSYHSTHQLLDAFSSYASNQSGSAHAVASQRVIQDLSMQMGRENQPWRQFSVYQINRAARKLLTQHAQE